jgi:uncharacterized phage-associated protein
MYNMLYLNRRNTFTPIIYKTEIYELMFENKYISYEYMLKNFLKWHNEEKGGDNDISILKSLKLLFFTTAAMTKNGKKSLLLDTIFTSFSAMPYGHVESRVYDYIKSKRGNLDFYVIDNYCVKVKEGVDINNLDLEMNVEVKKEIDASIDYLKQANSKLICLSAFELVELSHAWYSWKLYFLKAKQEGSKSINIDADVIKSEDKIFSLQIL